MMRENENRGLRRATLSRLLGCGAVLMVGFTTVASPGWAAQQAGVAAGVVGSLRVSEGERAAPEAIKTGMDMLLGDRVNSEKASRMQVLLLDETVFTIGPDSDLVIDEFVYDPAAGTGRLTANFTKGVMRYVSGKVALTNPGGVTIKSRDVTIGVRGTALFAMDDPDATDGSQFIGLLGPGGRNDGGLKVGGMTISTPQGTTDVFRAGFGTFVVPGQAPGPVVQTPPRLMIALQNQLTAPVPTGDAAPAGGNGEGDSGSGAGGDLAIADAADASGETAAAAGLDSMQVAGVLSELGVVSNTAGNASEQNTENASLGNEGEQLAGTPSGNTPPPSTDTPPSNTPPPSDTPPPPSNTPPPSTDTPPPVVNNPPPPTEPTPPPVTPPTVPPTTPPVVPVNNSTGSLPFGVPIPAAVEFVWSTIADLDLHLTGNFPDSTNSRFHIYYANLGNFTVAPFAQLDEDQTGVGGSEVIGISQFTAGAPYRASVFNFGDSTPGGTSLSTQGGVIMRYITNGQISRGPMGSTIVNGTEVARVSPTPGQAGNTWIGLEIDPSTHAATIINRSVDSASPDLVQ